MRVYCVDDHLLLTIEAVSLELKRKAVCYARQTSTAIPVKADMCALRMCTYVRCSSAACSPEHTVHYTCCQANAPPLRHKHLELVHMAA